MITNNIGTVLYSLFNGKKIGQDEEGNTFYIHRKDKRKRWVLYKNEIDPTKLDVKWQIWLTETDIDKLDTSDKTNFNWQKVKRTNPSGTVNSYHPVKKFNEKKINFKEQKKDSIWKPD